MILKSYIGDGLVGENSFLISDYRTGTTAIIDPSFLDKNTLSDIKRIDYILLTHAHYDHISSVAQIKKKYNAKIVCHKDEADILANANLNLSSEFGKKAEFEADILLEDNQTFMLGELPINVIHTPGHTKGGCCYIARDHLFTGDTVMKDTIGRTDLPTGDYSQLRKSIEKLKALDYNYTLHCGHGEDTKLDKEREFNYYFG